VDIGPYVALIALILGTPYMAYKKQWVLAGYFFLNAVAVVSGAFLGATELANMLTWASVVLLALGIYQLLRQTRASRSVT
jgi:putative Ca2+/H+ antiporter (TMEM165/GDT1 family)